MLTKSLSTLALTLFAAAPLAGASPIYIENNREDANALLGFELGNDGSLTKTSVVSTAGKGIVDPSLALGPFDSDQQIIANPNKSLVFAVNAGSNTVAVFKNTKTGLVPVAGSPFPSHGSNPVSLGLSGNILTVVNKHGDPAQMTNSELPNYTSFYVHSNGKLEWTGSKVEVANGTSPSQALISPFAPVVIGADFLGGILRSFHLDEDGTLTSVSAMGISTRAIPDTTTPRLPLGLAANPRHPLVYVGLPTANKIAVYRYNEWGTLRYQNVVGDSGTVVCWLAVNRAGTRLFASNTADPSVTVYDIEADPKAPKEITKFPLSSKGGSYQIALSADEKRLIVLTQRFQSTTPQGQGNEIHVLNIDSKSGALSEASGSPTVLDLPNDVRPQGIVVL